MLFIKDVLEIDNEKWKFSLGANEMDFFTLMGYPHHVFHLWKQEDTWNSSGNFKRFTLTGSTNRHPLSPLPQGAL
jgi:hypothetical protein